MHHRQRLRIHRGLRILRAHRLLRLLGRRSRDAMRGEMFRNDVPSGHAVHSVRALPAHALRPRVHLPQRPNVQAERPLGRYPRLHRDGVRGRVCVRRGSGVQPRCGFRRCPRMRPQTLFERLRMPDVLAVRRGGGGRRTRVHRDQVLERGPVRDKRELRSHAARPGLRSSPVHPRRRLRLRRLRRGVLPSQSLGVQRSGPVVVPARRIGVNPNRLRTTRRRPIHPQPSSPGHRSVGARTGCRGGRTR